VELDSLGVSVALLQCQLELDLEFSEVMDVMDVTDVHSQYVMSLYGCETRCVCQVVWEVRV